MNPSPEHPLSSTTPPPAEQISPAHSGPPTPPADVLTDRWPVLFRAMQDYKRQVADDFSAFAYRCVNQGLIRLDDRRRLNKAAARAGIRSFDAQLLIACAVRQWNLDQGRDRIAAMHKNRAAAAPSRAPWKSWTLFLAAGVSAELALLWLFIH